MPTRPSGFVGATTAGPFVGGIAVPIRAPFAATAASVIAVDDAGTQPLVVLCVDVGNDPGICSDTLDHDVVGRGIGGASVNTNIPAGTFVTYEVYASYVDVDGRIALGTKGKLTGALVPAS